VDTQYIRSRYDVNNKRRPGTEMGILISRHVNSEGQRTASRS
jgi:hypothetical protein